MHWQLSLLTQSHVEDDGYSKESLHRNNNKPCVVVPGVVVADVDGLEVVDNVVVVTERKSKACIQLAVLIQFAECNSYTYIVTQE